jgi:signal transduction histidine kinase
MKENNLNSRYIPNILIVDDNGTNLKLLDDILIPEGYKTRLVPGGELALIAAEKEKPDLILLDIMMPGIDGFEVCRRLKETPDLADIPVIFISALGDTDNIVNAFSVGGVDYINKPFQAEEVKARVCTHLKMHQQSLEHQLLNASLELKVEERTLELRKNNDNLELNILELKNAEEEIIKSRNEARKANLAKSEFLSRVSHELRTPMNAILGFAQLLEMGELNPKQKKGVSHILNSGKHLLELIDEVLDITDMESGKLVLLFESVEVSSIVEEMIDSVQALANASHIIIEPVNMPANPIFVMSDRKLLKQVLLNLLNNAVKYNRQGGSIFVKIETLKKNNEGVVSVRVSIKDTGLGIHPDDIPKLFLPFNRLGAENTKTEGLGLGLTVVRRIIDALEGMVGVESIVGEGSVFWIDLPSLYKIPVPRVA